LKISIRIRKSVKDRQNNDEKDKRTNNDKRNTKHKTKDRVTHTALKTNGEIKKGNSSVEDESFYFLRGNCVAQCCQITCIHVFSFAL
jgi:mannose-6-phosphate isomerase-like protein (cupin superfamily)